MNNTIQTIRIALVGFGLAILAACSGGAPTVLNQATSVATVASYTGPAPATADVQSFDVNLWQNIKVSNRCGACHYAGGQSPEFARNDDVNQAYAAANTVVNLSQPSQSTMVMKVGGGHNCWLASNAACASILTTWISNWAGATAGGSETIQLVAPPVQAVTPTVSFPTSAAAGAALYGSTIYTVTSQWCSRCHSSTAAVPQSPFFADPSVSVAYAAAQPKINLDVPTQSRFYQRLATEFHNCWSDCATDAAIMLTQINAFVAGLQVTPVDPTLVTSNAVTLTQGTIATGGSRYNGAQIALWQFQEGTGSTAFDTSGVDPGADLTLSPTVQFVGGWGIAISTPGQAQATTTTSQKLYNMITATGEYSIEAWIIPANVAQENAYIVSYSGGDSVRNATLGQHAFQYEAFNRSDVTDLNGTPSLLTSASAMLAQTALQHVVMTFDPVNGRKLYVNGVWTGDVDPQGGSTLESWDNSFALVLGNETSGDRQWQGTIKMAAIHNRALTPAQIMQNFNAGVGENYFLLFNVSSLTGVNQSYIMFQATQYDSYSYLFTSPTFISLDPTVTAANLPNITISGMRIGINSQEVSVGQAYIPLNVTVTGANYNPTTGELLSPIGTVIPLSKGPASDQFFLTFQQIGSTASTHNYTTPAPTPAAPPTLATVSDIGVHTFEQLDHSMSVLTGVPITNAGVAATYANVQQAMPSTPNLGAYLASNQTGVAQLAIQYCSSLVTDPVLGPAFFPGLNLSQPATSFFGGPGSAGNLAVENPLLTTVLGPNLASAPPSAAVQAELDNLISLLSAGNSGAGSTAAVATGACAALLGSGALVVE